MMADDEATLRLDRQDESEPITPRRQGLRTLLFELSEVGAERSLG